MIRIRIVCQHDPLFAAGLITHRRERRPFRALAREIASRLAVARVRRRKAGRTGTGPAPAAGKA